MPEGKSMREALEKAQEGKEEAFKDVVTADAARDATREIQVDREAYLEFVVPEEPPAQLELVGWYLYGLCSYFVLAVLLPVLFPLIVTQIASPPSDSSPSRGGECSQRESALYQRLVKHSILIAASKLSPLNWTAISWAAGAIIAAPILTQAAHHLDRGQYQSLILIAATTLGSFCCLLTGFFKTSWIFPFYIAFVASSFTVASAVHYRNLGLMVRGLTAHSVGKHLLLRRRAAASRLSLYSTASGGVGATLIAAFTYHMLRRTDQLTSLWVVSIFSGLIWFIGICHGLFSNRPGPSTPSPLEPSFLTNFAYILTLFNYPQAVGSLAAVFLSSFSTMCIFTSATLYIMGGLCIKPVIVLCFWMFYYIFPVFALPLLHPVQLLIRADAVRMQLLGFLLSAFVSGAGFYFKGHRWSPVHIILVGVVQSVAVGLLHAFGGVLLLDCSPAGKEGAFASWLAWVRVAGTCIGFAVGSSAPGRVGGPFGAAFLSTFLGLVVLVFGNVSNVGGMVAAGHLKAMEDERRSGGGGGGGGHKVAGEMGPASGSGEEREGYGRVVRV